MKRKGGWGRTLRLRVSPRRQYRQRDARDHLLLRRWPPQQWNFNNGQLQGIGTANGVSTRLEVKGSGDTPGALVQLSSCTGALNQQWTMMD